MHFDLNSNIKPEYKYMPKHEVRSTQRTPKPYTNHMRSVCVGILLNSTRYWIPENIYMNKCHSFAFYVSFLSIQYLCDTTDSRMSYAGTWAQITFSCN